ncbi:MAG TPA: Gfo/Idh/MocA family oxidoreductase [Pseudolysinimonas sp.]|nr:Gfo/Idh/MocA family oxidoreductase [Pseudolysinimonas sp.]
MNSFPTSLPQARVTPLRGGPALRWGILGPGDIASDFIKAIHTHTDQRVTAVASRSRDRARAFAEHWGIERSYGTPDALVKDPGVDIVYVATPHSEHMRLALLAIAAGKHVLVEKPLGVTADEARRIRDAASEAGVFAAEGMWSRYLPQTDVILRLIDDGVLGELRLVVADFATRAKVDLQGRIYNPVLAGGSLLDLGIYPLWFSHLMLGRPERVSAFGTLTETGVDAQTAIVLEYGSGAQAILATSLLFFSSERASVSGTEARIEVNPWFVVPAGFELISPRRGEPTLPYIDGSGLAFREGLAWEAAAIAGYIGEGRTDSALHPLEMAVGVLETMDDIRRQMGTA